MKPGLHIVQGPPASGKTRLALAWALEVLGRRGRVFWVGLPHQRAYVYRLLSEEGAFWAWSSSPSRPSTTGFWPRRGGLSPSFPERGGWPWWGRPCAGPGRGPWPRGGPALRPGHRRAEAVRDLPFALPKEGEAGRLRRVYRLYERLKAGSLDYDDFRHRALKAPLRLFPWPDLVVVDGFREVGPLDLRFLRRLSERVPVLLTLEVLPEGCTPTASSRPGRSPAGSSASPTPWRRPATSSGP